MGKDFKVRINPESARALTFMTVFGRLEVCVESPFPALATLPGFDEAQEVYKLDLEQIRPDERERLVNLLAVTFDLDKAEVLALLDERGVPILARECTLVIENPQRWL
jgi:hypothetical protein